MIRISLAVIWHSSTGADGVRPSFELIDSKLGLIPKAFPSITLITRQIGT